MYHLSAKMSAESSPDPDFTKACALLKKKIEKSMRAPLDALPSTRMCFSGRCHPLGLTIKTACCNTKHDSLKQHVHDNLMGECYKTSTQVQCAQYAAIHPACHQVCLSNCIISASVLIHRLCDFKAVACSQASRGLCSCVDIDSECWI